MKEWLKRTWLYNRFFSFLFLGAFLALFGLIFYVSVSYGHQKVYEEVFQKDAWKNIYSLEDVSRYDSVRDIPTIGVGNLCVLMYGNGYIRKSNLCESSLICYVAEQHEKMVPLLKEGHYPTDEEARREPCVVIGEGLTRYMYDQNGENYLYLGERYPCRVSGILKPYSLPRNDTRVYLFWNEMPDEAWNVLNTDSVQTIEICSSELFDSEQIEGFRCLENNDQTSDAESNSIQTVRSIHLTDSTQFNIDYFTDISTVIADRYYWVVYLFSILLLALLCYFWAVMNKNSWVVKLVYGFSQFQILKEVLGMFLYYEVTALAVVIAVGLPFAFITGKLSGVMEGIRYWAPLFVILFFGFTVGCCLIPAILLLQMKPAAVLKKE